MRADQIHCTRMRRQQGECRLRFRQKPTANVANRTKTQLQLSEDTDVRREIIKDSHRHASGNADNNSPTTRQINAVCFSRRPVFACLLQCCSSVVSLMLRLPGRARATCLFGLASPPRSASPRGSWLTNRESGISWTLCWRP